MEYAQKSIQIPNKSEYKYMMHCNDIDGYIRLSYNKNKRDIIRVTNRSIPINEAQKESFCLYSEFFEEGNSKGLPVGSYLFRDIAPNAYKKCLNWMSHMYKDVFKGLVIKDPNQLTIFDGEEIEK